MILLPFTVRRTLCSDGEGGEWLRGISQEAPSYPSCVAEVANWVEEVDAGNSLG
jgi:hypothetical protein